MDASGAPVTDELTGVHHSPQRDAIYEPEKTARRKSTLRHRPPQCSNTSRTSAQLYSTMSDTAELPSDGTEVLVCKKQLCSTVKLKPFHGCIYTKSSCILYCKNYHKTFFMATVHLILHLTFTFAYFPQFATKLQLNLVYFSCLY